MKKESTKKQHPMQSSDVKTKYRRIETLFLLKTVENINNKLTTGMTCIASATWWNRSHSGRI